MFVKPEPLVDMKQRTSFSVVNSVKTAIKFSKNYRFSTKFSDGSDPRTPNSHFWLPSAYMIYKNPIFEETI